MNNVTLDTFTVREFNDWISYLDYLIDEEQFTDEIQHRLIDVRKILIKLVKS